MTILQHIPFVVRFKDRVKVRTLLVVPYVQKAVKVSTQHCVPRHRLGYIPTLLPCFGSLFLVRPSPNSLPSRARALGVKGSPRKKNVLWCAARLQKPLPYVTIKLNLRFPYHIFDLTKKMIP